MNFGVKDGEENHSTRGSQDAGSGTCISLVSHCVGHNKYLRKWSGSHVSIFVLQKTSSWEIYMCVCLVMYQHCRWKAAGQWSQHSRSPPSRQLSQVSWLVARPALLLLLSNFRLRFSPSSDFGGASKVWIC